jgi:hypothetical protein
MEKELEEASWTLGASPWRTFLDVLLPPLLPSLLTGTALAFSRALGEFGSIVIISSNFAFKVRVRAVGGAGEEEQRTRMRQAAAEEAGEGGVPACSTKGEESQECTLVRMGSLQFRFLSFILPSFRI